MNLTQNQQKKELVRKLLESKAVNFDEALLLLEQDEKIVYVPSTFTYPYWQYPYTYTTPLGAGGTITLTNTGLTGNSTTTAFFNNENPT